MLHFLPYFLKVHSCRLLKTVIVFHVLQRSTSKAHMQWEAGARAKADNAIHPIQITVTLQCKRIGLVASQASRSTDCALPDISGLSVRPSVANKRTILVRWHGC